MHSYGLAGLNVSSEIALPGATEIAPDTLSPDVDIRLASVPEQLEDASLSGPTWMTEGDRFLLRIPDIARFLITHRNAADLDRLVRQDLHRQGLAGAIEIIGGHEHQKLIE